jgi:hypothetical protein
VGHIVVVAEPGDLLLLKLHGVTFNKIAKANNKKALLPGMPHPRGRSTPPTLRSEGVMLLL